MNFYKSCLIAVLAFTLTACDDETNVTQASVAAVTPSSSTATPSANSSGASTQSSVNDKPANALKEFYTSSMPDKFTIPHNTCSQGESLQTLKKESK